MAALEHRAIAAPPSCQTQYACQAQGPLCIHRSSAAQRQRSTAAKRGAKGGLCRQHSDKELREPTQLLGIQATRNPLLSTGMFCVR